MSTSVQHHRLHSGLIHLIRVSTKYSILVPRLLCAREPLNEAKDKGVYQCYTPLTPQYIYIQAIYILVIQQGKVEICLKSIQYVWQTFPRGFDTYSVTLQYTIFKFRSNQISDYRGLEYAIMKCLILIGQCEGFKSLRATIRGLYTQSPCPKLGAGFATTMQFMKKVLIKNKVLLIQTQIISCY